MFKQFVIIIFIISYSTVCCWAGDQLDTQIGNFNFRDLPTESKIVSEYGQGHVQIDKIEGKILGESLTYYIPDEKVWIEIHLSHVLDENLERFFESIMLHYCPVKKV